MQVTEMQRPPASNEGPAAHTSQTTSNSVPLPGPVNRHLHDLLAEMLLAGERDWWLAKAEEFERAKPVPGEFHGKATAGDLSAQWRRLDEIARACRNRATLCEYGNARQDVLDALRGVLG